MPFASCFRSPYIHLPLPVTPISPRLTSPRSDFAEQSRRRLEEAARRKEAEEREAAAQRHQRREYRTGQLTGAVACGA